MSKEHRMSYVIIDDNPSFILLMQKYAKELGLDLDAYSSLVELGSMGRLGTYDAAIVDYHLEPNFTGVDLAEGIEGLFENLPVTLISEDSLDQTKKWPKCIKSFLNKSYGVLNILKATQNQTVMGYES